MAEPCRDSNNGDLYCVYLVRCSDGTLYCGISVDLERRVRQHNEGKGSRYTASRGPVEIEFATVYRFTRAEAQAVEIRIKRQARVAKRPCLERVERNSREQERRRNP